MALGLVITPLLPLVLWGSYPFLLHAGGWERNYGWDWLSNSASSSSSSTPSPPSSHLIPAAALA
jgi:hypothetical protein